MGSTHAPVRAALLLAVAALFMAGCGDGGDGYGRSSTSAGEAGDGAEQVTIADYEYKPATITVPAGTTVTFSNRDSTPHTATSKQQGLFESGGIGSGKSGEVTLEETGTFAYYCLFHPFMKGTIRVE